MNIETEKARKLTTEQISIIEDLAVQAANDGGFMNRFIHERAIYVFAAVILYPEKKEELDKLIGAGYDIRAAFDKIIDDGTLEDMVQDYATDIDNLLAIGEQWFMDAAEFEHSVRGIINTISTLSGDIVQQAYQRLQEVASGDAAYVQQFAEQWGLGRDGKFDVVKGGKTEEE